MKTKDAASAPPSVEQAYRHFSNLCMRQECCPYDLEQKMKKKGMAASAIEQVIKRLKSEDFLNETRYCQAFVHDKLEFSRWGRMRIRRELRQRRLADEDIDRVLAEIDEEQYQKTLREVLVAYNRQVKARSSYEHWGKLMRYAFSRGFEQDLASDVAHELAGEGAEDDF